MAALPELLDYPDVWTCPATGIPIPKRRPRNILWRQQMLDRAEADEGFRAWWMQACAQSFSVWADSCVWTQRQRTIDEEGVQRALTGDAMFAPWICWPVHDMVHREFRACVRDGRDLIVQKSRDVRMTWHFMLEAVWDWLFNPGATVLLVSEKQELVDDADPSAMFPRLRFIIDHLPPWMIPDHRRRFKHLGNNETGATIDGRATTANFAVGSRKTWAGIDEAARIRPLQQIWDSTKSSTDTRVAWSTHTGPNFFADLCRSKHRVIDVGYEHHPEQGRGAEQRTDDDRGTYTGHPGRVYIWTPWLYQQVEEQHRSPKDLAQNVYRDPATAGQVVFDVPVLTRLRALAESTPPKHTGNLVHDQPNQFIADEELRSRTIARVRFVPMERGTLKLWCDLPNGRPPQNRAYVIGADPSNGLSAANSVAAILDADTGERVGAYASSSIGPADFARLLVALGLWFGGRTQAARVCWEANGPGETVGVHVGDLHYPRSWSDDQGKRWYTTRQNKIELCENLRSAWSRGLAVELDEDTIREAGDFIWQPGPRVEPRALVQDREAMATHGDRVIAAALAWMLCEGVADPKIEMPVPEEPRRARIEEAFRRAKFPKLARSDGWG